MSNLPSLDKIVDYWQDNYSHMFPDLKARIIGWGEPFCFRCGWLAPPPENNQWDKASGWLEKCHLQERCCRGNDDVSNLVPLCPSCHDRQPVCGTREEGIAYINENANCFSGLQFLTDAIAMTTWRSQTRRETFWRCAAICWEVAAVSHNPEFGTCDPELWLRVEKLNGEREDRRKEEEDRYRREIEAREQEKERVRVQERYELGIGCIFTSEFVVGPKEGVVVAGGFHPNDWPLSVRCISARLISRGCFFDLDMVEVFKDTSKTFLRVYQILSKDTIDVAL